MKKLFVLIFAFCLPLSSMAIECANCKIRSFGSGPYYDGICNKSCVFISLEGESTGNKPECATDTTWHLVLDTSEETGKKTMSILLAAYMSDKPVTVAGYDYCSIYSAAPDFRYVYLPW